MKIPNFISFLKRWKSRNLKEEKTPDVTVIRRKSVSSDSIRTRCKSLGWDLVEIPIKKSSINPNERVISSWKIIARKGERSIEVSGQDIDQALSNIGKMLGVVPR